MTLLTASNGFNPSSGGGVRAGKHRDWTQLRVHTRGCCGLDGPLDASNVVAVGSPGVLAEHASDLNLPAGGNVFASRAEYDIIGIATYATLGPAPMAAGFGGIPFEAASGRSGPLGIPTIDAHSSYWSQGNPAVENIGRIIAGRTDVTPPTFTP